MKKKVSAIQIITLIFVILYIIWEWNMQIYLVDDSLDYAVETRYDLMVILPVLIILIMISIWQYFKKK